MRYKKKQPISPQQAASQPSNSEVIHMGMLYVVDVRLVHANTGEKYKHKLIMVGCEHDDIERKLRWIFDATVYKEMSITGIEKVREKIHFLSTVITQVTANNPVIAREEGSQIVLQQTGRQEPYDPRLYAVGITTTMLAKDESHALHKVGHALVSQATEGKSHAGAALSTNSTVVIEEVHQSSGYAMPRNVSNEVNRAHMVRG